MNSTPEGTKAMQNMFAKGSIILAYLLTTVSLTTLCALCVYDIIYGCPNHSNMGCTINTYQTGNYTYTVYSNVSGVKWSFAVYYHLNNGRNCSTPDSGEYASEDQAVQAFNGSDYAALHTFEYNRAMGRCTKDIGSITDIWWVSVAGLFLVFPFVVFLWWMGISEVCLGSRTRS